jgi:hypothetical protein
VYTLCIDKNVAINSVYDYFNLNSVFYYYDYSFDYTDVQLQWWDAIETETENIHDIDVSGQNKYGYGHWDGTSISADGRFVLVGEPIDNRVYLYDTVKNVVEHTFTGTGYFGLRCAMDDLAMYFAIVGETNLYIYKRDLEDGSFELKYTKNHGYGTQVYHLKMSRNGNVILLSNGLNAMSIKKYETTDDWETDPDSEDIQVSESNIIRKVSAFDLTNNGNLIVAGQTTSSTSADFTVFYRDHANNNYANVYVNLTFADELYIHSFAISGDKNASDEYTILVGGAVKQTIETTATFRILTFNAITKTLSGDTAHDDHTEITTNNKGRFGRTCALSYDGTIGILSGTREANVAMEGSVIMIDMNTMQEIREFTFTGSTPLNTPILASAQHPSIELRYNKYGSGCLISSDNKRILVSGGGYAFMYKIPGLKNLFFPFTVNGIASDESVGFNGTDYSSNGVLINANQYIKLDFEEDQFFDTTKGFVISFFMKPYTTNYSSNIVRIRIGNDFTHWLTGGVESFNIRVGSYANGSGLVCLITNDTEPATQYTEQSIDLIGLTLSTSQSYYCRVHFKYNTSLDFKFHTQTFERFVSSTLGVTGYKSTSTQEIIIGSEVGVYVKDLRIATL